ncbi:MAG: hypothetical protein VX394_11190 [Pseudomonadota bacterium]|nr:hypothetical protein [Pseudomonadota bacterium]
MASQGAAAVAEHRLVIFSTQPQDLTILTAVAAAAGPAGFVAAATEADAIAAALAAETPSSGERLVVIDTRLPDAAADRVLTCLRGASVSGRMIALVPYSAQADEESIRAAGYDGFLATPLSPSRVHHLLTAATQA